MKRFRWWIVGLAVALLAVATASLVRRDGSVVSIEVEKVVRRASFRSYVTASGEIVATRFADVGSSVMGKIVKLAVAEGDRVRAGQLLAQIDPVQARSEATAATEQVRALEADEAAARQQVQAAASELAQAEARAREAATSLSRVQQLRRDGLTTAAELDSAQAAADAASAQVAAAMALVARAEQGFAAASRRVAQGEAQAVRADDTLRKTEVVAPIDGVVSRLQVREGEMVVIGIQNQPGTTLMTLSDLSAINAEVKVAEADVLRVTVGQVATVTLEAVPGRRFPGRVVEVGASALPIVGTTAAAREFKVVIRLDQPDPGFRPGLTCDAEILTSEKDNVLTVPLQAVVLRPAPDGTDDRSGVLRVESSRVRFVPVQTGIIGGLDVEVAGLNEGDPVAVGPFQVLRTLSDGAAVRSSGAGGRR